MVCHCAHAVKSFCQDVHFRHQSDLIPVTPHFMGMPKRINQNPQGRKVKISIGMLVGNLTANGEQNELHLR
jgi:hypothetical protein